MRVGMATSPVDSAIPAEADVLSAKAIYDTDAGSMVFSVTTAEEPEEDSEYIVVAAVGKYSEGVCSYETGQFTYPVSFVFAPMVKLESPNRRIAYTSTVDEFTESPDFNELEEASNIVDGTTTTLFAVAARFAAMPYDCAVVTTTEPGPEFLKPL